MEDVLYTFSSDGTSQEALCVVVLLNGKDLLVLYGTLALKINFIRCNYERAGLVLVHLIQPLGKVRERFLVGQVKYQHDPIESLVERGGDALKPFLSRWIPHLNPHQVLIDLYHNNHLIESNGGDLLAGDLEILGVTVPADEAGFPHIRIPKQPDVDLEVILLLSLIR
jgi:hypothetical protein